MLSGHYVREHTFERAFRLPTSQGGTVEYRPRFDFWFPQWGIVVEFKDGPLSHRASTKEEADRLIADKRAKNRPKEERMTLDWSNQRARFNLITDQANECPETADILWILVDDGQMSTSSSDQRRYSHYRSHQRDAFRAQLRRGAGWNPLGARQCGRLLWLFREVEEATGQSVWNKLEGEGYYESLNTFDQVACNVGWDNTKKQLMPELHTVDTYEGLHLVLDWEPDEEAACSGCGSSGLEPKANCPSCGAASGGPGTEVVSARTVPLFVPPQK